MSTLYALVSGTLFGGGLAVAQTTNPAKVLGFLDVAGNWDPSLAFVMGAALVVSAVAVNRKRAKTLASDPASTWGAGHDRDRCPLADRIGTLRRWLGFAPGPAIAALVTGSGQVTLFVLSMIAGMALYRLLPRADRARSIAMANAK